VSHRLGKHIGIHSYKALDYVRADTARRGGRRERKGRKSGRDGSGGHISESCEPLGSHRQNPAADSSGIMDRNSINPCFRFDSNAFFPRLLNGIDQQGSIFFDREGNSDLRCAFRGDREIFPDNPITNLLLPFGAGRRFPPEA